MSFALTHGVLILVLVGSLQWFAERLGQLMDGCFFTESGRDGVKNWS